LDLAGRDRRLRGAAIRELNRVVRVLPAVVSEPLRRTALVFEVAVAVEIPFLVDPVERPPLIWLEPSYEGGVCSPALVLVEQDQEELRGVVGPVVRTVWVEAEADELASP